MTNSIKFQRRVPDVFHRELNGLVLIDPRRVILEQLTLTYKKHIAYSSEMFWNSTESAAVSRHEICNGREMQSGNAL